VENDVADLHIKKLAVGPMDNNVYVLTCAATRESAVVDAANDAAQILAAVKGTTVQYILQTHGHPDHVQALDEVKRATEAPLAVHPADAAMLPVTPDILLQDGQELRLGHHDIRVLHTPGHTPGGVCFLTGRYLLSGDTLFPGGPGNTRSDPGSFAQIIESVRRLFTLPEETIVLPGHGADTTIGQEKPHLAEWIRRGW
jgi:glyoxylase-like metal-dependent hydrolase (beta-lactamase superfamily II)